MNDTDSGNTRSDDDDGRDDVLSSVSVRELCNQLRTNDPSLLANDFRFDPFENIAGFSEAECIEVFFKPSRRIPA